MALEPATYGEDLEVEFERTALMPVTAPRRACGKWAWFSKEKGYMPFRCGSSNCSKECAKIFHWRRIKLVDALVREHGLIRFFTLTIARDYDKVKSWDEIQHVWSMFRKRMKRRFNPFKYVAVLEGHKDGYPHIHGFTNVFMWQEEWSEIWADCGGGPVVWVEKVKEAGLSQYVAKQLEVAKYIGKDQLHSAQESKGNHRTLWRTEHMKAKFELTKTGDWSIIKEVVYDVDGSLTERYQKEQSKWQANSDRSGESTPRRI